MKYRYRNKSSRRELTGENKNKAITGTQHITNSSVHSHWNWLDSNDSSPEYQ